MGKEKIFVCLPAYNEEKTIGSAISSILEQELVSFSIEKIVVVNSGSTDGTGKIVQDWVSRSEKVVLINEEERRGKASAINLFLGQIPDGSLCVLMSSDVMLADRYALEDLLSPFQDPSVGMTTSRPVPVNKKNTFMGKIVHLLWELKHRVSLISPKTGEAVAFRKIFEGIPNDTLVDEASIEYEITKRGLKIVYCPNAVVLNKGPETVSDFIKQRKRIYIGHKLLERQYGYKGSTFDFRLLVKAISEVVVEDPGNLFPMIAFIILEIWARLLGRVDLFLGRYDRKGRWEMVETSKGLE